MTLSVEKPKIAEVLELETGECVQATTVIGSDPGRVSQLRLALRTGLDDESPLFACPVCGVPVYLVAQETSPDERPSARKFFFRHQIEDGRCPARTRGLLSQDEIDARKYNGAKESRLHRQMKDWIAECLRADARFSDVEIEPTWKGAITGDIRRPDVRATINGTPVAFEIQLSTTHLNVISGRRLFYLKEGGLLFWVFARFNEESRRLMQDDVFYNNNQNAFVLTEDVVTLSRERGELHFECIWAEPTEDGAAAPLRREVVSFHALTCDLATQRAYFFDFEGAQRALGMAAEEEREHLRLRFESFWLAHSPYGSSPELREWNLLRRAFAAKGYPLPRYWNEMPRGPLNALYSVKHGRPVGWGFKSLVEVAHQVAAPRNRSSLALFSRALHVYGRIEQLRSEDKSGKWAEKAAELNAARKAGMLSFKQDQTWLPLVKYLFPELAAGHQSAEGQPVR